MYMHACISMYVFCMYVYACMVVVGCPAICKYVYQFKRPHAFISLLTCTVVHVDTYVCMCVCVYVCMRVCMYVCMYVRVYTYT